MNSLSVDDLLRVLQYLPGKDVTRLTRLNQRFKTVVLTHRRILRKPSVSVRVVPLGFSYEPEELTLFFSTPKGTFHLTTNPLAPLGLEPMMGEKGTSLAVEFLAPFQNFEFCDDRSKLEQILELIFSKIEIEVLEMNQYHPLNDLLKLVIKLANCSIFKLKLDYKLNRSKNNRYSPEFQEWLSEICTFQQKQGVSVKLQLDPESFAFSTTLDFLPKLYAMMFSEVVLCFCSECISNLIGWVTQTWAKGELDAETTKMLRFRFCPTFYNPVSLKKTLNFINFYETTILGKREEVVVTQIGDEIFIVLETSLKNLLRIRVTKESDSILISVYNEIL